MRRLAATTPAALALALLIMPPARAQQGGGSGSGEEDPSIAAIEAESRNRLASEQRRLVARYADDLATLKKTQQDKGDTAGAAATATEITRAKAALAEGGDPGAFLTSLGKPAAVAAAAPATDAAAPDEPDPSRKAVTLKPDNARNIGGTPWLSEGSGKVWTVAEAAPGLYSIVLSGSASRSGSISARVGAGQRAGAKFSPGTLDLTLGRISITTTPVELFLTVSDIKTYSENPAIDLRNVTLRPVKLSAPAAPK